MGFMQQSEYHGSMQLTDPTYVQVQVQRACRLHRSRVQYEAPGNLLVAREKFYRN